MLSPFMLCFVAFTVQNVAAWNGIAMVGSGGADGQVYIPDVVAYIKADDFG